MVLIHFALTNFNQAPNAMAPTAVKLLPERVQRYLRCAASAVPNRVPPPAPGARVDR